jgi:Pregnancy-associated plasma protein-A
LLVHEVGHWLGLPHVFEGYDEKKAPNGGCVPPGDGIKDTPAQASPPYSCEKVLDTCPLDLGPDPLDNYMNYVPDVCMNKFTAGQRLAMRAAWFRYRAPATPMPVAPIKVPVPAPMMIMMGMGMMMK